MITRIILFLSILTSLLSCKKDNSTVSIEAEQKFVLTKLTSQIPLDLNFDGKASIDLLEELPLLSKASFFTIGNAEKGLSQLYWYEPRIENISFLSPIPQNYSNKTKVEYLPVERSYYYQLEDNKSKIIFGDKWVDDSNRKSYTLKFPDEAQVSDQGNTITFLTSQTCLLEEGFIVVPVTVVFTMVK